MPVITCHCGFKTDDAEAYKSHRRTPMCSDARCMRCGQIRSEHGRDLDDMLGESNLTYCPGELRFLPVSETDLEEAREHYFGAGGLESDIGPRSEPIWYWRRAAKIWRALIEKRSQEAYDKGRKDAPVDAQAVAETYHRETWADREMLVRLATLLREWRDTPYFATKTEWKEWTDEFGKRVDKALASQPREWWELIGRSIREPSAPRVPAAFNTVVQLIICVCTCGFEQRCKSDDDWSFAAVMHYRSGCNGQVSMRIDAWRPER